MKPTHAELAAALEHKNWALLWEHAFPLVELTVRRLAREGSAAVDLDDLLQEGMLIAGTAMRKWQPLECAFSTYLCNRVRWQLSLHRGSERNHGLASYWTSTTVLSLCDSTGFESAEEDDDSPTFETALTYEGVPRTAGQVDGSGVAPEGYGDPVDEADRLQREERIRVAIDSVSDGPTRRVLHAIASGACVADYAAAALLPLRTVERTLAAGRKILAAKLGATQTLNKQ